MSYIWIYISDMISPSNDLGEEEIGVAGLEEEVGEGHQER